eukprot:2262718-Amphidinium_carterae.1
MTGLGPRGTGGKGTLAWSGHSVKCPDSATYANVLHHRPTGCRDCLASLQTLRACSRTTPAEQTQRLLPWPLVVLFTHHQLHEKTH